MTIELCECYKCTHAHVIKKEVYLSQDFYSYTHKEWIHNRFPSKSEYCLICDKEDKEMTLGDLHTGQWCPTYDMHPFYVKKKKGVKNED